MAKINVNITGISSISPRIKSIRIDKISLISTGVNTIRNGMDNQLAKYSIAGKDNMYNRLSNVYNRIKAVERDLEIIEKILESAYKNYEQAETTIKGKAASLEDTKLKTMIDFMNAYKSLFGNDSLFTTTHTGSSGRGHGGNGRNFDGSKSEFSEKDLYLMSSIYEKIYAGTMTLPFTIISVQKDASDKIKSLYDDFVKKYDDGIGAIETISSFGDIILNGGNASTFTEIMGKVGLPSELTDIIDYGTSVKDCIEAVRLGDRDVFFEKAQDIGLNILDDILAKDNPAISAAINMAAKSVENTVEKGIEFLLDPDVEKFGDLIYSSTLKSINEGAMETAYEIVESIPVLGTWMTGEYESLSGKSGLEGVLDCQKRLLNEMIDSCDGFNGWVEGMQVWGREIEKGANNVKDAVVNGFKSIFT